MSFTITRILLSFSSFSLFEEYANGFVLERERTKGRPDDLRTFQRENNILVPLDQNEKGAIKNSQKVYINKKE